jgi:hypothetical protein
MHSTLSPGSTLLVLLFVTCTGTSSLQNIVMNFIILYNIQAYTRNLINIFMMKYALCKISSFHGGDYE